MHTISRPANIQDCCPRAAPNFPKTPSTEALGNLTTLLQAVDHVEYSDSEGEAPAPAPEKHQTVSIQEAIPIKKEVTHTSPAQEAKPKMSALTAALKSQTVPQATVQPEVATNSLLAAYPSTQQTQQMRAVSPVANTQRPMSPLGRRGSGTQSPKPQMRPVAQPESGMPSTSSPQSQQNQNMTQHPQMPASTMSQMSTQLTPQEMHRLYCQYRLCCAQGLYESPEPTQSCANTTSMPVQSQAPVQMRNQAEAETEALISACAAEFRNAIHAATSNQLSTEDIDALARAKACSVILEIHAANMRRNQNQFR